MINGIVGLGEVIVRPRCYGILEIDPVFFVDLREEVREGGDAFGLVLENGPGSRYPGVEAPSEFLDAGRLQGIYPYSVEKIGACVPLTTNIGVLLNSLR